MEETKEIVQPLKIIHTDIMESIKPVSHITRKKYIIIFLDDFSRLARAYTMTSKLEAFKYFEEFLKSSRNLLRKNEKVSYLRLD